MKAMIVARALLLASLSFTACAVDAPQDEEDLDSAMESTIDSAVVSLSTNLVLTAPDPIRNVSERCRGLNNVTWTAVAGATSYTLYRSTSSDFSNPLAIYSGPSTDRFITVNYNSTWYLRAVACDSSGCGPLSGQVSASYFSGCQ